MKRLLVALLAASALTLGTTSEAQAQFTFGPGVAFHDDADLGIGVFFATPMPSIHEQVDLWGSFVYFFPDGGGSNIDVSYWELNGGLSYDFPIEASVTPYVLAGLNVAHGSASYSGPFDDFIDEEYSDTDIGLTLGGGIKAPLGDLVGIAGARFEVGGGEGFVIEAGLGFPMGG